MKKTAASPALLHLLVRLYNQSIQSYYFFPDVILCGSFRLEREAFEELLRQGFIHSYYTDSFGKRYHLTHKAEEFLCEQGQMRRHRHRTKLLPQPTLFAYN